MKINVDIMDAMKAWQEERLGPCTSADNTALEAQEIITMALNPLMRDPVLIKAAIHALLTYVTAEQIEAYLAEMKGD